MTIYGTVIVSRTKYFSRLNLKNISEQINLWRRWESKKSRMRKGGARGPAAPQPGFAFAANPELNFRDVGEAEV